jgi:hypothetical protein
VRYSFASFVISAILPAVPPSQSTQPREQPTRRSYGRKQTTHIQRAKECDREKELLREKELQQAKQEDEEAQPKKRRSTRGRG